MISEGICKVQYGQLRGAIRVYLAARKETVDSWARFGKLGFSNALMSSNVGSEIVSAASFALPLSDFEPISRPGAPLEVGTVDGVGIV